MSEKNRAAAVARNLEISMAGTTYATPHKLISSSLRAQNSKARATVVELLGREFNLRSFDAETIARSAADLTQLKEAVRAPQKRRYGQFEIQIIEFDVVTWRILPSIENIRFEGDRAWEAGKARRYTSLGEGMPVLGLKADDTDELVRSLRKQTELIWRSNDHSKSIPMRGIENPGLLSVTRLSLGENPMIGVLDATDGFSRTVGAQRGSGVDIDDVLFGLQNEAAENKLRLELLELRDSGAADIESEAGEVAAARLRSSIMPRAQVIVGYQKIGSPASRQPKFDDVRRALVGHIHLEPPMVFADTTKYALKSRIALEAVNSEGLLPVPAGLEAESVLDVLRAEAESEASVSGPVLGGLHPDEVLLLATESLVSALDTRRRRIVGSALHALTGKRPLKPELAALASDTAMRVDRIARGLKEDTAFKGRRSTMQKVLQTKTLNKATLTRRSILDIRDEAIRKLREQHSDLEDVTNDISAAAAELGVLGLYCLVEGALHVAADKKRPLLARSSARGPEGDYLPEPQQIIEGMVASEVGIQQLAQTILDVRSGRVPRKLVEGDTASAQPRTDRHVLEVEDLYAYKPGNWSSKKIDTSSDPYVSLELHRKQIVEGVQALQAITANLKRIETTDGFGLADTQGVALDAEWQALNDLVWAYRTWSSLVVGPSPSIPSTAEASNDEDDQDSPDLDGETGYESDEGYDDEYENVNLMS